MRVCEADNQLMNETSPQGTALELSHADRSLISVLSLLHPLNQGLIN